ncbi:hypothetical protein ABB55_02710 [Prosthecomicrobium hirschii]|uniref:Uncharacterized protein n=1 Tax=Prosthecodimorpha hirschii TaxID=665126 RepID=A0A0P6VJI4_9HYPH|nr:nucleotidyltransferase family protein [Prosthecomicrobium hirschii]KPL51266.1 hypothetical protein ABB55_02710 [Prosthecomicrobium hirschii]
MTALTARERLLLTATLAVEDAKALAAWQEWSSAIAMEAAPHAELRILPAVHARLARIRPLPPLPQKLIGTARATFTQNSILAAAAYDLLRALDTAGVPVLVSKGFTHCLQFQSFARRTMGDIDITVWESALDRALEVLKAEGWEPCYGMTWAALRSRVRIRRESWNFTKGAGNIDLHWRVSNDPREAWLEDAVWREARTVAFRGLPVLVPSPEASLLAALRHAAHGLSSDVMQMIVDAPDWLARADRTRFLDIAQRAQVGKTYEIMRSTLQEVGADTALPPLPGSASTPHWPLEREDGLVRHPRIYRLWAALGHSAAIERPLLRWLGPLSRPLQPLAATQDKIDLRDCATVDAVGGPGWGWPEPEHTCCWADRADARLLLPLPARADQWLVLVLGPNHASGPNPGFRVFANGHEIARGGDDGRTAVLLPIRAYMLHGAWVELAIRPVRYADERRDSLHHRRTIAASRIEILDSDRLVERLSEMPPGGLARDILNGDERKAAKLGRIRQKMAASPDRQNDALPTGFDGLAYVLAYADLFEHEVDPYHHYLNHGREEGRRW